MDKAKEHKEEEELTVSDYSGNSGGPVLSKPMFASYAPRTEYGDCGEVVEGFLGNSLCL